MFFRDEAAVFLHVSNDDDPSPGGVPVNCEARIEAALRRHGVQGGLRWRRLAENLQGMRSRWLVVQCAHPDDIYSGFTH